MDRSETIGELVKALATAQAHMPSVTKDALNPHFGSKFADLADVMKETLPHLAKHGLAVVQLPGGGIENQHLTTVLMHVSGEFISTQMPMFMPTGTSQAQGSALTYARRQSYSAMVGIAPDADDDGQAATEQAPARRRYTGRTIDTATEYPNQPHDGPTAITQKQVNFLRSLLAKQEITSDEDINLVVGGYVGREVTDIKALSLAEAKTAIDKAKEAS